MMLFQYSLNVVNKGGIVKFFWLIFSVLLIFFVVGYHFANAGVLLLTKHQV